MNNWAMRTIERMTFRKWPALFALTLTLAGCISLGGEPPESLLTLSPEARAPVGAGAAAGPDRPVIAVMPIEAAAKLDVLRVPVAVSDTELAYLQEAFWVEKPARLFRGLLGEAIRARGNALVMDNDETVALATVTLRGNLIDMGYVASDSAVVVRFDAIRIAGDGTTTTRRFEARESGVPAEGRAVGAAINRAANTVTGEVADWVAAG